MLTEALARFDRMVRQLVVRYSPTGGISEYARGRELFLDLLKDEVPPIWTPPYRVERELWGIVHQSNVMWAAGVDKEARLYHISARQGAGAHMVGTFTSSSRGGNEKDGFVRPFVPLASSASALNWLGLPNPSVYVAAQRLESLEHWKGCPLWASVAADPEKKDTRQLELLVRDICELRDAGAKVIELNESCPNTGDETRAVYDRLAYVTTHLKWCVPRVVKFSTDTLQEDVPKLLDMLFELGYGGVNFGNSSRAYKVLKGRIAKDDQKTFDFFTKKFGGGLTGRVLKERSLALCARAIKYCNAGPPAQEFHVVRTGGVENAKDLLESDQAGVSMNQWFTGYFDAFARRGHGVYKKMLNEYEILRAEKEWKQIEEVYAQVREVIAK